MSEQAPQYGGDDSGHSDSDLLARVVRFPWNGRRLRSEPRWVALMDVCSVGSTTAIRLCQRFGFDPYGFPHEDNR